MSTTNILESINRLLVETGIRNMKTFAKNFKEAEIIFHMDLDGVCSAIGLKQYLKNYGIKTTRATPVQYGGKEYAIKKVSKGKLICLCDFAHAKPVLNLWLDHHDAEHIGATGDMSTSFVTAPSNVAFISQTLSPSDLFPPADIKIISTVDSADFASQDLTPDDIMRAAFKLDKTIDVSKNHRAMGFVCNKLILAYKNKPGFLDELVMKANPSLISLYNVTKKLAKDNGYIPPEKIVAAHAGYEERQSEKTNKQGKISDVAGLKSGASVLIGTTIVQYGGGSMPAGAYDRYTPFKLYPESDYFCIAWGMGLLQVSKNPFKKGKNPYHLGKVCQEALKKHKGYLDKQIITLEHVKYVFERDGAKIKDAMGFTFDDLIALFGKKAKGMGKDKSSWKEMIKDITNKPFKYLSRKQKDMLKKVTITAWDLIETQSGGHRDISNISGLNFIPGRAADDVSYYIKFMRKLQVTVAEMMKDKHLE